MNRQLQRLSFGMVLLVLLASCESDDIAPPPSSSSDPIQPIQPVSGPILPRCDSSTRVKVNARLVPVGRLSVGRDLVTVAAVGTKILFAGGSEVNPMTGSTRVDIYDAATNAWSTAELSQARFGMAAVTAGSKVFFAGGKVGDGVFMWTDTDWGTYYTTVDIYDAATNTWSVAHLSEPRAGIAAATVGNKVLFAGGLKDAHYASSATVDIYDLATGAWSTARLREPKNSLSAVALNGKVYFAGGYTEGWSGESSRNIEIYDGATNSWTSASLLRPMGVITGAAVGNRIFWAEHCTVEIRDVQTGIRTNEYLYKQGLLIHAVAGDNKVVFFRTSLYDESRQFDIYDLARDMWFLGEVSQDIREVCVISVNNTIYLVNKKNSAGYNAVFKLEF